MPMHIRQSEGRRSSERTYEQGTIMGTVRNKGLPDSVSFSGDDIHTNRKN